MPLPITTSSSAANERRKMTEHQERDTAERYRQSGRQSTATRRRDTVE